jgi:hypothetical protein
MHSTSTSDTRRSILRFVVAAVIVGLAIPLLPLFGEGGRLDFIFSSGLPWRFLVVYLLRWWVSALVALFGIWLLMRDRGVPRAVCSWRWGSVWPSGSLRRSSSPHHTSVDGSLTCWRLRRWKRSL